MTDDQRQGRSVHERVGALEQDMNTVQYRLDRFERNHDDLPLRVGRLELIAQNQTKLLEAMEANMHALGQKVMYGLGGAGAIIAVVQLVGPHLLRALAPQ